MTWAPGETFDECVPGKKHAHDDEHLLYDGQIAVCKCQHCGMLTLWIDDEMVGYTEAETE